MTKYGEKSEKMIPDLVNISIVEVEQALYKL